MRRSLESSRPILAKQRDSANPDNGITPNAASNSNSNNSNSNNSNSYSNSTAANTTARSSNRFSTYSLSPSLAYTEKSSMSSSSSNSSDPRYNEVQRYHKTVDRMQDKRLQDQRYSVSSQKDDDMNKLALAAKLQKAIDRRYSSQDAVFKPKQKSEKSSSGR